MIIKNKRTGAERIVTLEEWTAMKDHPQLQGKYVVVDSREMTEVNKTTRAKVAIVPEEILNWKKRQTETLKETTEPKERKKKKENNK